MVDARLGWEKEKWGDKKRGEDLWVWATYSLKEGEEGKRGNKEEGEKRKKEWENNCRPGEALTREKGQGRLIQYSTVYKAFFKRRQIETGKEIEL